ncbi:MAG TPA: hypothetical protein VNR65_14340 [Geobacterales bacterium]|nr:hypothetical protein [Geobacterales bacterium]
MTRPSARHPLDLFEGREDYPAQAGRGYGVPGAAKNTGDPARPNAIDLVPRAEIHIP